jgi:ABC-type lipoprotein release transport system permease subunit
VNHIFNGAALGADLSHFATLPFIQALLIIVLALAMNFLGAIFPSAFASKKDAALALRSD